jgi:hypothetical protein
MQISMSRPDKWSLQTVRSSCPAKTNPPFEEILTNQIPAWRGKSRTLNTGECQELPPPPPPLFAAVLNWATQPTRRSSSRQVWGPSHLLEPRDAYSMKWMEWTRKHGQKGKPHASKVKTADTGASLGVRLTISCRVDGTSRLARVTQIPNLKNLPSPHKNHNNSTKECSGKESL